MALQAARDNIDERNQLGLWVSSAPTDIGDIEDLDGGAAPLRSRRRPGYDLFCLPVLG